MNTILQRHIEDEIIVRLNKKEHFSWNQISGGSINQCFKLKGPHHEFFVKSNQTEVFCNGFQEEKKGLQFLIQHGLRVPKVLLEGKFENQIFLVLEWIKPGNKSAGFWQDLADQLSKLHHRTSESFGLDHSNYMGQLHQENSLSSDFVDFFIKNRLEPQVAMAFENKMLDKRHVSNFEKLYLELPSLIPKEEPTAIHGDLWSGNYICDHSNTAVFIDPAVYYGHREVDLAMSLLFGGFAQEFYQNYQENYPLESGFNKRVDLYNLYPLLVHLNLFGLGYLGQIEGIVSQY